MGFLPAAGYGHMFAVTRASMVADGFEVKHVAPEVMRFAMGELIFDRFLNQSKNAFGIGKGGTFTIPFAKEMGLVSTTPSPLTSGTAIGVGTQKWDTVSMAMQEYGTGIAYETIEDWITNIDVQSELTQTLGNHIGRMSNALAQSVYDAGKFSIECPAVGSLSALLGTNRNIGGTLQADYNELTPGAVALTYDTFRKSLVRPRTDRGFYVWIANGETLRPLKNGSMFQNYSLYSDFRGQRFQVLGEFMNFVFVEVEEGLNKGTSYALGANMGGYGFGMLPRTFAYPDFGQDAGRLTVFKTLFYRGQGEILRDKGTSLITIRSKTGAFSYGSMF